MIDLDQHAAELSRALNSFRNGRFMAMIFPSAKYERSVGYWSMEGNQHLFRWHARMISEFMPKMEEPQPSIISIYPPDCGELIGFAYNS